VPGYTELVWLLTRIVDWSSQGSLELWPRLGGEDVRGLTSVAVPTDVMGTASVETMKVLPVQACKNLLTM
jgi:hypothetical protein